MGVVLLAGCALRAPRPRPAGAPPAEALLDTLAARRGAVVSLRARARLRAGLSGAWTREALIVQRPDAVRIDVLSPFGLALAVGARGALLWAYPPAGATRYEGAATPANVNRFLGAPVSVPDVVDVLLGLPPRRAPAAPPTVTTTDAGEHLLSVPLHDGVQSIWFAADALTVLRAEEARGGVTVLRIRFGDHRDGFPRELEIAVPEGAAAALAYDAVELNPVVDPALFAPPPAPRVLALEAVPG